MSWLSCYLYGLNRWTTHLVWSQRRQCGKTDTGRSWRVSLCYGCRAAHCPFAVVGPDNVAVFHTWHKCEIMVMGLSADIDNFAISAELISCDDAIRVLWWSPGYLHWLWASYLQRKGQSSHQTELQSAQQNVKQNLTQIIISSIIILTISYVKM